jgi:glycine cleavage system regulatory protein
MADTLIVTFITPDRPGIVEQLSKTVSDIGGNWMESRMAHLAGTFAGVARVSAPDGKTPDIRAAMLALESEDFQVMVKFAADIPDGAASAKGPLLELELMGPDHPGIVMEVTRCLAAAGVSVEEMVTWVEGAPVGGGMLFYAEAKVRLPTGLSEDDLESALDATANALMVDISVGDED